MFSDLGITRSELERDRLTCPTALLKCTLGPLMQPGLLLGHGFRAYALTGGGCLRRTVDFVEPTLARPFMGNPWRGYSGPAWVPVNAV
jgi:hypothetical protein